MTRPPKWLVWHGTRLHLEAGAGYAGYHGAHYGSAVDVRPFERGSRPKWVARWFATDACGYGHTPRGALDDLTRAIDKDAARARRVAELMRVGPVADLLHT